VKDEKINYFILFYFISSFEIVPKAADKFFKNGQNQNCLFEGFSFLFAN
jgi:hypothetical protein